jgi:hypothetical protein
VAISVRERRVVLLILLRVDTGSPLERGVVVALSASRCFRRVIYFHVHKALSNSRFAVREMGAASGLQRSRLRPSIMILVATDRLRLVVRILLS